MTTPWDEPAAAVRFIGGLERDPAVFYGSLAEVVRHVLAQPNNGGDGYIVRLDDASAEWEGPAIFDLGELLVNERGG
jgi:hypothetical protein